MRLLRDYYETILVCSLGARKSPGIPGKKLDCCLFLVMFMFHVDVLELVMFHVYVVDELDRRPTNQPKTLREPIITQRGPLRTTEDN